MANALEIDDLSVTFNTSLGPLRAVDRLSLVVEEGETMGIVGESGSGKSVLARTIMNLHDRNTEVSGAVRVLGRDITTPNSAHMNHFWGVEVAMVFQDPMTSLNPTMRVHAQLSEGLRYHRGCSKREAGAAALSLLERVGIPDARRRLRQYPHELSGGMRQRVVIAMALACEPKLLIADEPTTALDVTVQRQILDLLDELRLERGMAMVLITHDLGVVKGRTDKVVVMYGGRIVERGVTTDVCGSPRHPYTDGLLRSAPRLDGPQHGRLHVISGLPPNPFSVGSGCRFSPRCPAASEQCLIETPAMETTDDGQAYACFHPLSPASCLSKSMVEVVGEMTC